MANSYVEYSGNDTDGPWTVTFPYIDKAHVKVYNGATEDTTFTWFSDTQINTTSVVPTGTIVHIKRASSQGTKLVDYQDAAVLTEATLDLDANQGFYMAQEAIDTVDRAPVRPPGVDTWDFDNKKITNVADGTADTDGVSKLQVTTLTAADVQLAKDWATKTDGIVAATDYSAKEYAQGVDRGNTGGSAKDWAQYTAGAVSGGEFSAKKHAIDANASASAAASSAADAATDAASASADATATAADVVATNAKYDEFDDRYLGVKSSDPTLDNDGDALVSGALYWNSSSSAMKVYNGSSWDTLKNEPGPTAKGSVLVDQSASVRAQLAVGTDGQVLTADSAQTNGIKWATPSAGATFEEMLSDWYGVTAPGDSSGINNDCTGAAVYVPFRVSNATGKSRTPSYVIGTDGGSVNYGISTMSGPGTCREQAGTTGPDSILGMDFDPVTELLVCVGVADATDAGIFSTPTFSAFNERSNPKNKHLRAVVYCPNSALMCAVGDFDGTDAYIVTSPGSGSYVTWTEQSNPKNYSLYSLARSPTLNSPAGRLCAAGAYDGSDGYIVTSDDEGSTWTERSNGFTGTIWDLIWDSWNSQFVACGDNGKVATSSDGITWTDRTFGGLTVPWKAVVATPLGLVLFTSGTDPNLMYYSTDAGVNWTQHNGPVQGPVLANFEGARYVGGRILQMGNGAHSFAQGVIMSRLFESIE